MDFLWGAIAIMLGAIFVVAGVAALVQGLRTHTRDVRIVDMRNRGCSVSEIAKALNSTDEQVRKAMKRITGSVGPTTGSP
jgi:hypothetical protein